MLTASLFERFASRDLDLFQNQVLSAMRFGFGGHLEKRSSAMDRSRDPTRSCSSAPRGDLAYKKIFPALQAMARRGKLDFPVVGVAKSDWSTSSSSSAPAPA